MKISDLSMLNKATAPYDTITSASFVDWSAGFELSSVVMASQASIEDAAKLATIANTRAEVVKLRCTRTRTRTRWRLYLLACSVGRCS
ncbi:hypothetical protein GS884_08890 [Rhodococcus hoagii]|nr:hypothetical protein [Prescottella equi]